MRWVIVVVAAAMVWAGCVGLSDDAGTDTSSGEATTNSSQIKNFSKPHTHDYWGNRDQKKFMDRPIRVYMAHNHMTDQPPRDMHTHGCEEALASTSQGGSVVFTFPPGHIVYPGTSRLKVFTEWEDPSITGVKVRYRAPDQANFTELGTMTNQGHETISLTETMTDQGHERRSRWDFSLCAWSDDSPADVARGSIKVKIWGYRVEGELPLDPGHPDQWEGRDEIELGNASWSGPSAAAAWRGDGEWFRAQLDDRVPWDADGARFVCQGDLSGLPEDPVVETWYASPARKTAWDFNHIELNSTGNGSWAATIPLSPSQTDGVYGDETLWKIWFRVRSPTATETPADLGYWSAPQTGQGELDCSIKILEDR